MKSLTKITVISIFLSATSTIGAQSLEKIGGFDIPENKFVCTEADSQGNFIGYIYGDQIETAKLDLHGKISKTKTNLPEGIYWYLTRLGDKYYFKGSQFSKNTYTIYMAYYDVKANKIDVPKILCQISSKSDPYRHVKSITSPNDLYFGEIIYSGHTVHLESAGDVFTADNSTIVVYDSDLEILYTKQLPFTYNEKEFDYNINDCLTDDGTLYSFGKFLNKKNSPNRYTYAVTITTPDGSTTGPTKGDWNIDDITSMNTMIDDNKIIHFGLWGDNEDVNVMKGTYYVEIDINTFNLKLEQKTSLTNNDQLKFTRIPFLQKKIEKGSGVPDMQFKGSFLLKGNIIASVYRRTGQIEMGKPDFEYSSVIVAFLGPKPEDNKTVIIQLNQQTPWKSDMLGLDAFMINDKIIVLFNDNTTNATLTTEGGPAKYNPYQGDANSTGVYAMIINENGEVKRQELATLENDKFSFEGARYFSNSNQLVVFGNGNPDTKIAYQSLEKSESKSEPKLMIFKLIE